MESSDSDSEKDYDSNSDLEIISEKDESEDEEEDQKESSTLENESIYPIWNPPTTKMKNPHTGKNYKASEITKLYHEFVNEQWTDLPELSEEERNPFIFSPDAVGCQGVETTPLQVFEKFCCSGIIKLMVEGSNAYSVSARYKEKHKKRKKPDGPWNQPLAPADMYIFLAICILSSIHNKQQLKDNWSEDEYLSCPIFSKLMSRDRYMFIRQILHVSTDEDKDDDDPLWKVRRFIDKLNSNYQQGYKLGACISIDESLQLYRGHHSLIHYVPNKAARFGLKLYVLAESDTGFVWRFIYDMGPKTKLLKDCPTNFSKPDKIVWTLMASVPSVLNEGRVLGMDNYYTSINLFYLLSKYKTDAIGTVRKNRKGLPQKVVKLKWKKKTEKGNRTLAFNDRFFVMNWMDKKEVVLLSSISNGLRENDIAAIRKGRQGDLKPQCVHEYNRIMPGVDLNDQMKFGRKVARRRVKTFYKTIIFHQFDTLLVNSFIYYKKIPENGKYPNEKCTQNDFRLLLVKVLVSKYAKHATTTNGI